MGIFNKFEEKLPCEKEKKNTNSKLNAAASNLNAAATNLNKQSDNSLYAPSMNSNMNSSKSPNRGGSPQSSNNNNSTTSDMPGSYNSGSARIGNVKQGRNNSPNTSDESSSGSDYATSRQSVESSETDRSIIDTMKVAAPMEDSYNQKSNNYNDTSSNPYRSQNNGRNSPDVSRNARGGVTNGYGSTNNDSIPSAGGQKLGNSKPNVSLIPKKTNRRRPSASDFVNQVQRNYERYGGRPNASADNLRKQGQNQNNHNSNNVGSYNSDDSYEDSRSNGYVSSNSNSGGGYSSGRQQNTNSNNNNNSRPGYERSNSYISRKNQNQSSNNNYNNNNSRRDDSPDDYEPPKASFRSDDRRPNNAGSRQNSSRNNNNYNTYDEPIPSNPRDARMRGQEDAMRDMKIVDEGGRRGGNFNSSRGYGNNDDSYESGYGRNSNDSYSSSNGRGNQSSTWNSRDSGSYSPPNAKPAKFNTERKMDMAYEAGYKDAMEKIKKNMMSQFNN